MMYARGTITVATIALRESPYCAAPRTVAVSASGGRAITLILPENLAYTETHVQLIAVYPRSTTTRLHFSKQVLAPCEASHEKQRINPLLDLS